MVVLVALEVALTLVASGAVTAVLLRSSDPGKQAWGAGLLAFIWLLQALMLLVRRGGWRTSTLEAPALLALVARRARAAILLTWLNLGGTLVALALTLPVTLHAGPGVPPDRLARALVIITVVLVPFVGFCAWFLRQQRRRLAAVRALLRDIGG
jgi:hypothetical protein